MIGPETGKQVSFLSAFVPAGTVEQRAGARRPAGEPARSPFFCGDFLHYLDLEVAFGHQLLQPRILASSCRRRLTSVA
jgi:hypothetical protein